MWYLKNKKLVIGNIFCELVSTNCWNIQCDITTIIEKQFYVSLFLALFAFGLDPDAMGNVSLLGENNQPIPKEKFPVVVLQYLNCSHFFIKIAIKSDANEPLIVQVKFTRIISI